MATLSDRASKGWLIMALLVLLGGAAEARAQATDACSLDAWADGIFAAWMSRTTVANADCYHGIVTYMDTERGLRDEVVARFDEVFPGSDTRSWDSIR